MHLHKPWETPCVGASARTPSSTKRRIRKRKQEVPFPFLSLWFFNPLGCNGNTMHLLRSVGGGLSFLQSLCQKL